MKSLDIWSEEVGERIAAALLEYVPAGLMAEAHLRTAILTAACRPGKLLRGRLAFGTASAHGVEDRVALALAAAVEYFHLSSLLLDDLPCMDDASTRRGLPCTHRVHGEATALLAALAFINRAYALMGFAFMTESGAVRFHAQACLDATLGWAGLIGGQARDLRFGEGEQAVREIGAIALGKTGAVFSLGLLLPALLAKPSREECRALKALCIYWSLAFQGLDDLQDVIGTSVDAGKTTGRDRARARPNLAISLGLAPARRRVTRLLGQADRQVGRLVRLRGAWSYLEQAQRYFGDAASLADGAASAA